MRYGESSELGELAERLQRMSQEGAGMGEEEFRQANEEAARALGNLPDSESDERLLNLTRCLRSQPYLKISAMEDLFLLGLWNRPRV